MNRSLLLILLMFAPLLFSTCKKKEKDQSDDPVPQTTSNNVNFQFANVANGSNLILSNKKYVNANKDSVIITGISYWVSNVKIRNTNGSWYSAPKSYYFIRNDIIQVDETFQLTNIPLGVYDSIQFSIGVDQIHNDDITIQDGELAVGTGFNWTWNTGYIFLELYGSYYNTTNSSFDVFKYEIGTNDNYSQIALKLPSTLQVQTDNKPSVKLNANILTIFGGPNIMTLQSAPAIVADPKSQQIVENYLRMFDVVSVDNN